MEQSKIYWASERSFIHGWREEDKREKGGKGNIKANPSKAETPGDDNFPFFSFFIQYTNG